MKRLVIAATIVTLIIHNVAGANADNKKIVQSIEPAFVNTENADDGYKIPFEELLKPGGTINWLLNTAKGRDAARVQTVAKNVLRARKAGKEYLEDWSTIALLEVLLEKYPSNKLKVSGTKRIRIQETVRRTTPAIRGFEALGIHHSNHSKQQGSQEFQTTPTTPSNIYKISYISKIDTIRAQIAKEHGEKVAETMISVGTYRAAVEESAKERRIAITLQGNRLIGGHLKFIVFEKEVYFRVSALPKGMYHVSDFSKIDTIRAQIAKDYGEKIAETMGFASTYKTGIEEAISKRKTTITLHDNKITDGYLRFIIVEGKVQYGIVQYKKKSE